MGVEENKEIAKEFVERFAKWDNSVVDELIPENMIGHVLSGGIQTMTGDLREVMKQTNDVGHIAWPDYEMAIEEIIAEGDRVMVLVTRRGTNTGKFYNMIPTNKSVEVARIYIFRMENGKIAESWMMEDHLGMYIQMGVLPPSPEFRQAYNEAHNLE